MSRGSVWFLVIFGCQGGSTGSVADDASADGAGDADTDADADADTDSDADTDTGTTGSTGTGGLAVLGGGTHDVANVTVTEVLTAADDLAQPTDVAFHPEVPWQLWITNHADDSIVIVEDAGQAGQNASWRHDATSNHFLAKPSALAFGEPGIFATIHHEDERTQGPATPPDFMGPTLWTSDASIFEGGDVSHLDMLHNSPNGMGIAWEQANVYWVFDGWHESLTRYDFGDDHGLGGTDHTDGTVLRYVEGEVGYVATSVSHLAYDPATELLYVADSGNGRIAVLDTTSGTRGAPIQPDYDGGEQFHYEGAVLSTLIDTADGLEMPAGLELADGLLWVTDANTATIWAFDLQGNAIDWLPLGRDPGALQGLTLDDDGNVWVADILADVVLRISP